MTATPALSPDIFGKYQKRISDDLHLDRKESEGVLVELQKFAMELLSGNDMSGSTLFNYALAREVKEAARNVITNSDPGDENESRTSS